MESSRWEPACRGRRSTFSEEESRMERALKLGRALPLFLALVVGGGLAIGYFTAPGEWYAQLEKPGFNPPGWVFGPVWTVLYVLIAIAGWRVWRRDSAGRPMRLWWGSSRSISSGHRSSSRPI
jgi:hypothetical protein